MTIANHQIFEAGDIRLHSGETLVSACLAYVTHGELVASDVMRKRICEKFGWDAEVPELFEEVEI